MSEGGWDTAAWPWDIRGVRILPVLHGRLEFARAARAHLEALRPDEVVVEVPSVLERSWLSALEQLPRRVSALRIELGRDRLRWLLVEPSDAAVEAGRWALEAGVVLRAGDLLLPDYAPRQDPLPDPATLTEVGYASYVRAWLDHAPAEPGPDDVLREQALAAAALEATEGGRRVVLVVGLAHLERIATLIEKGASAQPLARPLKPGVAVVPVHPDSLVEVTSEMPFVQAAWERARAGLEPVSAYEPPGRQSARGGRIVRFPGSAGRAPSGPASEPEDPELVDETQVRERGDDPLFRPRLLHRLVEQAERLAHQTSGSEPSLHEKRVLHRFARNLALIAGRLTPDLYELVVAARGSVDDSFARDLLRLASHWPFAQAGDEGVRLRAADLGRDTRLVTLRPHIDRISRRPSIESALRRLKDDWKPGDIGICSHIPEDLVIEGIGDKLRRLGSTRSSRAGVQIVPFTASLLDGVDARETLRRFIVDGRPWVRDEIAVRAEVGAVVMIFDEDEGEDERYGWQQVWHGEHQNESDMAFYATDPGPGYLAPGVHRAEYGGLLMIWPPWRMGDVWHDPAYRFCRGKAERLLVGALDYSTSKLVVYVARQRPRRQVLALARRLNKKVVHVPPGVMPRDMLRRVRTFHVLADKRLRPLADAIIDPPEPPRSQP